MKTPTLLFAATVLLAQASPARAQTAADSAAIRQASLDYIEGWYAGDAARMERSLHPDLTKRIVVTMPNGTSTLSQMSAMGLVRGTRAGGGKATPQDRQRKDVRILDVYGNAASVRVTAAGWIDYLHLGKTGGEWSIINILWEREPRPRP